MDLNESETRVQNIDRQLKRAGWIEEQGNLVKEFALNLPPSPSVMRETGARYRSGDEFVDYMLLDKSGKPVAIVEAKRNSRDPLAGKRQAADYADRVHTSYHTDPFIFLSNGETIWFWDRSRYQPRMVSGFFTPDDLERLVFQRHQRQLLSQSDIDTHIAGRPYQIEAIRHVSEGLEVGRRKFLLVMATGTGKTRTTIALIDLLMRTRWAQRVLFLADRRELVRQALGDLKEYLPNETRARVEGGQIETEARIHVATYPSMMQVYQQLSPGYYDLLIADESHRSIYNRYRALFDYFDAIQLGLTATPTDYIDHDTFALFNCPGGLPTFYYSYETAVQEEYLVTYRVLDSQTRFQLQGIQAGQLPLEIQQQLEEQGIELSEIDFEGSDLERRVTNTGTNDAIVQEFMEKCRRDATGILPAKTIFFAISHRHAVELWESFNRLYPDLQRQGLAEVIDSHMERADKTLDDFKRKNMPRVAISVDMLDTGIDIPAIQNLVFAKPVFSQVKFWQMIGRGTRRWTDPLAGQPKTDFLIIDYWNNFAYFNMNPQGEIARPTEPLPVRLFRLRLEKLGILRTQHNHKAADDTVAELQAMLQQLPSDNVNIRPYLGELAELERPSVWEHFDQQTMEQLSTKIAPLLRFLPGVNLAVMTFVVHTERLMLAHLSGQTDQIAKLREQIVTNIQQLNPRQPEVLAQKEKLTWMTSNGFWEHLAYDRIIDLQATCAPLMPYRRTQRQDIIKLTLPDEIARRRWIVYGPAGEGAFADNYREQVEAYIKALQERVPALQKLKRGDLLDDADMQNLQAELNRPDLFISEDVLRQVYERPDANLVDFLKHILGLSHLPSREEQIKIAFDDFIARHPHFTANQITFLRTLRSAVLRRARLTSRDLEQPPFSRVGSAHTLFSTDELAEILDFANELAA